MNTRGLGSGCILHVIIAAKVDGVTTSSENGWVLHIDVAATFDGVAMSDTSCVSRSVRERIDVVARVDVKTTTCAGMEPSDHVGRVGRRDDRTYSHTLPVRDRPAFSTGLGRSGCVVRVRRDWVLDCRAADCAVLLCVVSVLSEICVLSTYLLCLLNCLLYPLCPLNCPLCQLYPLCLLCEVAVRVHDLSDPLSMYLLCLPYELAALRWELQALCPATIRGQVITHSTRHVIVLMPPDQELRVTQDVYQRREMIHRNRQAVLARTKASIAQVPQHEARDMSYEILVRQSVRKLEEAEWAHKSVDLGHDQDVGILEMGAHGKEVDQVRPIWGVPGKDHAAFSFSDDEKAIGDCLGPSAVKDTCGEQGSRLVARKSGHVDGEATSLSSQMDR